MNHPLRPPVTLLANTAPSGVSICTDAEGLLSALSSGAKQVLGGVSAHELSAMLPIPHATDVLHVVAECRILHSPHMAAELTQALHLRVQMVAESHPILRIALAELLQNAIEHGNLGLGLTRHQQVNTTTWFETYHATLNAALAGPLGRIPVRLSFRVTENTLQIEIEDRGLGFRVREIIARSGGPSAATGRGLGLLQKLLGGSLTYAAGGRIAQFSVLIKPQSMARATLALREQKRVVAWASTPARAPLLERALRSVGCKHIQVFSSLKDTLAQASNAHVLVLDGDGPNFASLGYGLADLPRTAPQLPVLIWAPRAPETAFTMALNHPCMDVAAAGCSFNELGLRLERLLQNASATQSHTQLQAAQQQEVERTRNFQRDMLPKASKIAHLSQSHNVQLGAYYQGCETLAGDYWNAHEVGPQHLAFALMDFTGHGVRAALNTVQLHALLKNEWNTADPADIAASLNASLHKLLGAGCFATYVYLVLNTKTGAFTYCAGGTPALLVKSSNGIVKEYAANGLPLGLTAKLTPQLRTGELKKGETLLMYSDALTDAPHTNGQRWEQAGLTRVWQQIPAAMQARNAMQALLEVFHKTVALPLPDDLTVLAVKR